MQLSVLFVLLGISLACDPFNGTGTVELSGTLTCAGGEGFLFENVYKLHCNGHIVQGRGKKGEFAADHVPYMDNCIFLGWDGVMNVSTYLDVEITAKNVFVKNPPANATVAFKFQNTSTMFFDNTEISGYEIGLQGSTIAHATFTSVNLVGVKPISVTQIADFYLMDSTINGTLDIGAVTATTIGNSVLTANSDGLLLQVNRPYTMTMTDTALIGSVYLSYYGGGVNLTRVTIQDGLLSLNTETSNTYCIFAGLQVYNSSVSYSAPQLTASNVLLDHSKFTMGGSQHTYTGLTIKNSNFLDSAYTSTFAGVSVTSSSVVLQCGSLTTTNMNFKNATVGFLGRGDISQNNVTIDSSIVDYHVESGTMTDVTVTNCPIDFTDIGAGVTLDNWKVTEGSLRFHPTSNSSLSTVKDSSFTATVANWTLLEVDDAPVTLSNVKLTDTATPKNEYLARFSGSFVTLDDVTCSGGTCFSITAGTVSGTVTAASADTVCCAVIATIDITMGGEAVTCRSCF